MRPIRLILAYEDALCRAGLRALLERIPGVVVAAETGDGREAISLAKRLRPDLALLEDALPGLGGIDAAARIAASGPAVRILMFSDRADAPSVAGAFQAGAKGYLLKSASPRELARAIREVMAGKVHVGAGVSRRLLRSPARTHDPLTPRQREVLKMVAEGWSTKQVAQILRISVKTVETHRAQLMERLAIFDVPGLVRYALKTRLTRL